MTVKDVTFESARESFVNDVARMHDGEPPIGGAAQQDPPVIVEQDPEIERVSSGAIGLGVPSDPPTLTTPVEVVEPPLVPTAAPDEPQHVSREKFEELQRQHYMTQGMLQTLAKLGPKAQPVAPEPSNPMRYFDGYRAPSRPEGTSEPDWVAQQLAHAVGHAAEQIRQTEVAPLREQMQQVLQAQQVNQQYIANQRATAAEANFDRMLSARLEKAGFVEGHPQTDTAKDYVTQFSQMAHASGQTNGWSDDRWGTFMDDATTKAAAFWPAPPSGAPSLSVIENTPRAPVGPGNTSVAPKRPGSTRPVPKTFAELNKNFAEDLDKTFSF